MSQVISTLVRLRTHMHVHAFLSLLESSSPPWRLTASMPGSLPRFYWVTDPTRAHMLFKFKEQHIRGRHERWVMSINVPNAITRGGGAHSFTAPHVTGRPCFPTVNQNETVTVRNDLSVKRDEIETMLIEEYHKSLTGLVWNLVLKV